MFSSSLSHFSARSDGGHVALLATWKGSGHQRLLLGIADEHPGLPDVVLLYLALKLELKSLGTAPVKCLK